MRKKNSAATPPAGNTPSGTNITPPNGEHPSTPSPTPSLNTLSVNIATDPAGNPAGMPRRQFLKGLATAGAGIAVGAIAASAPTPALASFPTATPGSPNSWEASQGIYSGVVNLVTGNVQLTIPITSHSGVGGGLNFSLFFNSQSTRTSYFGYRWTCSYNYYIVGTNPAIVIADDGTETPFGLSGSTYTPITGCYDMLVHNVGGTWTLTKKSGAVLQFNSSGNLTSLTDTQGNVTTVTGGGTGTISISDATGRTISLTQVGPDILAITDNTGKQWNIGYGGANQPASIALPAISGTTYTVYFGYDASHNVNQITDVGGKLWKYTYTGTSLISTTDPNINSATLT